MQSREPINTRINSMESFLSSLERNIERQLFVFGFRTLFLAEDYITKTGNYIPDVTLLFNESFFNGSIFGESSDVLEGAKYSDIVNEINYYASKINVDVSFDAPSIEVTQDNPWEIKLIFSANLTMSDKSGLAMWQRQETVNSSIGIRGFEDPLYIVNTNAKIASKINKTIYEGIYVSGNDVSNLLSHMQAGYYTSNTEAPSFLNRLSGNLTADKNGIESLVDLSRLSGQGITVSDKSVVDYIYFSASNPANKAVNGMPSWFKLDDAHLAKYNATGLAY